MLKLLCILAGSMIVLFFIPNTEIAYQIDEKDLIPEGITYSTTSNSFFISSLHKSKIIKLDAATGRWSDFLSPESGYLPGLGLDVAEREKELWAIGTQLASDEKESRIFVFDLLSGRLKRFFEVKDSVKHFFNDVVLDGMGNAYVTDSDNHSIYLVRQQKEIVLFLSSAELKYPNGITISNDGKYLYVASFVHGIRVVEISTKTIVNQADTTDQTRGIDGLVLFERSLIGVQNGFQDRTQHKIVRYYLDPTGTKITGSQVLVEGGKYLNMPTTAVCQDSHLYFIANSQLRNLDQENNLIINDSILKSILILRLSLL